MVALPYPAPYPLTKLIAIVQQTRRKSSTPVPALSIKDKEGATVFCTIPETVRIDIVSLAFFVQDQ